MPKVVEFKFDLDQRVVTSLGDTGIITMFGYDDTGIQYCVRTSASHSWWKEMDLTPRDTCGA